MGEQESPEYTHSVQSLASQMVINTDSNTKVVPEGEWYIITNNKKIASAAKSLEANLDFVTTGDNRMRALCNIGFENLMVLAASNHKVLEEKGITRSTLRKALLFTGFQETDIIRSNHLHNVLRGVQDPAKAKNKQKSDRITKLLVELDKKNPGDSSLGRRK